MKKVCFLFIDQSYFIYHSIGIAISLHQNRNAKVTILCTERNHETIQQILSNHNASDISIKIIRPFWHFTLPHHLEIKLQFRYFLFKRYKKLLAGFDGIVSLIYNDLALKKLLPDTVKFIFAGHGVANSSYSYKDVVKGFDYLLLAGEKEKAIRQSKNQLTENNHTVIGYVKYEMCEKLKAENPFDNNKPIVLYNPHWEKSISSYFEFGTKIFEQFSQQDEYNLIFAPHNLLVTRNKSVLVAINKFKKFSNIHIDFGSQSSHDMSYLKVADVYLGDGSSQALEFALHEYRPCLIIDINHTPKEDYTLHSWEFGNIVSDVDNIFDKIKTAITDHKRKFLAIQEKEVEALFYRSNEKPSELAAEAIMGYLGE